MSYLCHLNFSFLLVGLILHFLAGVQCFLLYGPFSLHFLPATLDSEFIGVSEGGLDPLLPTILLLCCHCVDMTLLIVICVKSVLCVIAATTTTTTADREEYFSNGTEQR